MFTGTIMDNGRISSRAFIRVSCMPWCKQQLK